jgi:hypothetical protein
MANVYDMFDSVTSDGKAFLEAMKELNKEETGKEFVLDTLLPLAETLVGSINTMTAEIDSSGTDLKDAAADSGRIAALAGNITSMFIPELKEQYGSIPDDRDDDTYEQKKEDVKGHVGQFTSTFGSFVAEWADESSSGWGKNGGQLLDALAGLMRRDQSGVDTDNESRLKALQPGDKIEFHQMEGVVVLGDFVGSRRKSAWSAGEVEMIAKGSGLFNTGDIRVTGDYDEATFTKAIRRFSNKDIEFA